MQDICFHSFLSRNDWYLGTDELCVTHQLVLRPSLGRCTLEAEAYSVASDSLCCSMAKPAQSQDATSAEDVERA